jgi:hypothetical protein
VAREGGAAALSSEWRAWVAENLLLRVPKADLIATLTENGVPAAVASREIEVLRRSPLLRGADRVARRLRKHEIVLRMRRTMAALASSPGTVERRSNVSRQELFDRFYSASTPLVVTDALDPWPALAGWTPARLKERFADVMVEATTGREADPLYEPKFKSHCALVRFGDLCDRMMQGGETNDLYLVANNYLLNRPDFAPLIDDVRAPHPYLDARRDGHCISVWIGPAGTITPLHHDTGNVLFCQVHGRKKVILFPALELFLTYDAHHGVHSPIDAEHPDLEAHPEMAEATRKEVILSPGEALFIPVGWWHHVRALDPSISVSFTSFGLKNRFDWYYPGLAK